VLSKDQNSLEDKKIDELGQLLGILMHHDAITGTANKRVVNDYMERIDKGVKIVKSLYKFYLEYTFYSFSSNGSPIIQASPIQLCNVINNQTCSLMELEDINFEKYSVMYNSFADQVSGVRILKLITANPNYDILDHKGNIISAHFICELENNDNFQAQEPTEKKGEKE
jgi:hypothetical protein